MSPKPWQAVIFDFDGVLVESTTIKADAFYCLYRDHGEAVATAVRRYHELHGGMSRYQKFGYFQQQLLGGEPLSAAQLRALDNRFSAMVMQAVIACPAVAGAEALLRLAAVDTPLFVASGTPETELREIVRQRGWRPWFRDVRGSPAPKAELVADIVETHALDPDHVLMVGDAMEDYHSAVSNSVHFVGRVAAGLDNPFPAGVQTVTDMTALLHARGGLHGLPAHPAPP